MIYNISVGAALPGEVGTNPANIWIYCITGPGQVISGNSLAEPGEDYYLSAIQNRRTAEALPGNDTRWIFLYPKFFQYLSAPQPDPGICLKILPHFNKYVQRNLNYVNFRLWILVHELAHHYSFETHERVTEYSYANDCVALSGSDAVVNVQNYVYYIASESSGCLVAVRGSRNCRELDSDGLADLYNRCTNYPDWRGPWWWRKVELLEIDPHNSTTSNHTVSVTNANITLPQNNS